MKQIGKLLLCIIGCELVGLAGTPFTINAIPNWYANLNKPVFAPPNWIFGPVWTLLYFLMGISIYLIWKKGLKTKKRRDAITIFLIQLILNFVWSPIFFGLRSPFMGLIVIVAMWIVIVLTMNKFFSLSKLAFYLLIPYLLWVTFATILNFSILLLN